MARGLEISLQAPIDSVMRSNLESVGGMARKWWPDWSAAGIDAPVAEPPVRMERRGLFFTGGVDSTFALRRCVDEIDDLVFVEGFDVPLDDEPQLERVRGSIARMASMTDRGLVIVRTNLRSHRLFKSIPWEFAHVSALAAVAHALGDHFGTLNLADSDVPPPYGSQPELDELWSSGSVAIRSIGEGHTRLQRVKAICDWPMARGHLRVCWKNSGTSLNCGHCKKCLLTRLQLQAAGDVLEMDSFPALPLRETFERVARAEPGSGYPHFWEEVMEELEDEHLKAAIARMLRTPARASVAKRLKRWLAMLVRGK